MLDNKYVDPILGFLLPGAGDLLSSGMGLYIVAAAARAGIAKRVLARMLVNLAVDAAGGAIPIVGDLFDAFFKANQRNLALFDSSVARGGGASTGDNLVLVLAGVLLLAALALPVIVVVLIVSALA